MKLCGRAFYGSASRRSGHVIGSLNLGGGGALERLIIPADGALYPPSILLPSRSAAHTEHREELRGEGGREGGGKKQAAGGRGRRLD